MDERKKKKFLSLLTKYQKTIPKRYNNLESLKALLDDDVDVLMLLSNRKDGKSFNIAAFLAILAVECGYVSVGFVNKPTLRTGYLDTFIAVANRVKRFEGMTVSERKTVYTYQIYFDDVLVFSVLSLSHAYSTKYYREALGGCSIFWYDEFVTDPYKYIDNEVMRMSIIHETLDVDTATPKLFPHIKTILSGNTLNFESEFFSSLEMFDRLERVKHDELTIENHTALLVSHNQAAQDEGVKFLYGKDTQLDEQFSARFDTNIFNRAEVPTIANFVIVKLETKYLRIYFEQYRKPLMKLTSHETDYDYYLNLRDAKETAIYLDKDKFFKDRIERLHAKGAFSYSDTYTMQTVTTVLPDLNIYKLSPRVEPITLDNATPRELEDFDKRQTLKRLSQKYYF